MDEFKILLPTLLTFSISFIAKSDIFLGIFNIKKVNIDKFCDNIIVKIKQLKKETLRNIIEKSKENNEVVDPWLLDMVERNNRTQKLENLLLVFNKYQICYFQIIMNIIIFSVILTLVLVGIIIFMHTFTISIFSHSTVIWIMYIFTVSVFLFVFIGAGLLNRKKEHLRELDNEIGLANMNINIQS